MPCIYGAEEIQFNKLKIYEWESVKTSNPNQGKNTHVYYTAKEVLTSLLFIGRGYGIMMYKSKSSTSIKIPASFELINEFLASAPKPSQNVYKVIITDERAHHGARQDQLGKGWARNKFYNQSEDKTKMPVFGLVVNSSPSLYLSTNLTYEDGLELPCLQVQPNDESTIMAVHVKLHGLKENKSLNGMMVAACCGGPSIPSKLLWW